METIVVNGRKLAKKLKAEVKEEVQELAVTGLVPGLVVILVGEDRASQAYVGSKQKACARAGIHSELISLKDSVTETDLLAHIEELNSRDEIDGILVQTPLPDHIDEQKVMRTIDPDKDVDGFHPVNVGKLTIGQETLVPATPLGIMEIFKDNSIELKGKNAVVIGRSDIVGKPISLLMLHEHATVTICHSRTRDLAAVAGKADILVAAVGRAAMVTKDFVKPGAVVIDVGINDLGDPDKVKELFGDDESRTADLRKKGYTLVGDVHPEVEQVAGLFTPVPKGVGPLTIAMLLKNCLQAARSRRGGS